MRTTEINIHSFMKQLDKASTKLREGNTPLNCLIILDNAYNLIVTEYSFSSSISPYDPITGLRLFKGLNGDQSLLYFKDLKGDPELLIFQRVIL